jgi:hypothetical protein
MSDFTRSIRRCRRAKLSTASGRAGSCTHPIGVRFAQEDGINSLRFKRSVIVRMHDGDTAECSCEKRTLHMP